MFQMICSFGCVHTTTDYFFENPAAYLKINKCKWVCQSFCSAQAWAWPKDKVTKIHKTVLRSGQAQFTN